MKTDGIILDIDGTLWDSTPIVAKAWNEVIAQRKDVPVRLTAKQLTGLFGRTLEVIADMVFPFLEKEDRYTLIMPVATGNMNCSTNATMTFSIPV